MQSSVCVIREEIHVNTIWETQNDLHMRAASNPRKCGSRSTISVFRAVAIAPPRYTSHFLIDIGLGCRCCAAGECVEVWRKGNLGVVDILIICLKCCWIDLSVVVSIHIVESWCPCTIALALNAKVSERCHARVKKWIQ